MGAASVRHLLQAAFECYTRKPCGLVIDPIPLAPVICIWQFITHQSLLPHLDIGSGPNTFRLGALVQRISTAGQRERYAPRYFIIGVESYMLCGKRHITVEYCEHVPLFLFPFVEDVRFWTFIMGVLGPFGRSYVIHLLYDENV